MCTRRTNRFLLLCFIVLFPVTLASAAGAGEQVEGGGDPTPGGVTLTDARGEDVVEGGMQITERGTTKSTKGTKKE